MTPIEMRDGLPFVTIDIFHDGNFVHLQNVLLDTGSHSTLLATDSVSVVGLCPELTDTVREIYGIGGSETVIEKQVSLLRLGARSASNFRVELGAMSYGFPLDAIIGIDFLRTVGAVIDLDIMELTYKNERSL